MAPGDAGKVTRILVVDDHQLVRAGLVALLDGADDLEVVGQAADGAAAVEVAADTTPDVVLMDLSMPIMDGVAATRALLEARPEIAVVVLTSFADQVRVAEALAAGAVGYLLKDSHPRDLLAGIRAAAAGHAPLDPRVARSLLPSGRAPDPAAQLSHRELQVLRLVTKGMANKQIGRALGISEHTVKVSLTADGIESAPLSPTEPRRTARPRPGHRLIILRSRVPTRMAGSSLSVGCI
jgi:DNA-binding NarL/FixJ family response regulator